MSVLIAYSLLDGVLLAADCRATIPQKGKESLYVDNVQKLFGLTDCIAIGFVGDIMIGGSIIREILSTRHRLKRRNKLNPVNFQRWLPRFLRDRYNRLSRGKDDRVIFVVASVVRDYCNVIPRSRVAAVMRDLTNNAIATGGHFSISPSLGPYVVQSAGTTGDSVTLPQAPKALTYSLRSPDFCPKPISPMQYEAFGTGHEVSSELGNVNVLLFGGNANPRLLESMAVRTALDDFIKRKGIPSVGRMYTMLRVGDDGIIGLGYGVTAPPNVRIEMAPRRDYRWVQRDSSTGQEIVVRLPWEIDFSQITSSQLFSSGRTASEFVDMANAAYSDKMRRHTASRENRADTGDKPSGGVEEPKGSPP
jgi:hypothetical protein